MNIIIGGNMPKSPGSTSDTGMSKTKNNISQTCMTTTTNDYRGKCFQRHISTNTILQYVTIQKKNVNVLAIEFIEIVAIYKRFTCISILQCIMNNSII